MMASNREEVVSKFASLLGTKGPNNGIGSSISESKPSSRSPSDLLMCLSKGVESHEVICTVPSLDMQKVDEEAGASLLPKVGEHRKVDTAIGTIDEEDKGVPHMEASVLSNAADASAKAAQMEQKAAQSLGSLTSWTKSSVAYAAEAISKNVSSSFSNLVDSRVRAWTLLLLRHSLTTGDSTSRSRLLSMLSSIIKVESAMTTFKTLPLPEAAAGQPKEADVILPLLLEVDMKITIQTKADMVTLRAPGTISGNFERTDGADDGSSLGLVKVDIRLDTGALLDSMVQQARMVVFKAVAKATAATGALPSDVGNKLGLGSAATQGQAPSATLSGFSSALNLSSSPGSAAASSGVERGPHQPNHRLQKARSSALRLNSVLQGDAGKGGASPLDKTRKSRSIQWDHPMDLPKMKSPALPTPKRQRVAQTSARLTSFKSFGRPHAGDFGSGPRNATFGDFGRKPFWGRDGKLANHPSPMQNTDHDPNDMLNPGVSSSKNATFDFQRPSIHLSSGLNLGVTTKQRSEMNRVPSSIPRTATALEGWLMNNTNPGGKMF